MASEEYFFAGSAMGDSVRSLLKRMMETGEVESVLALRSTGREGRFCYSLVSDPSLLETVLPFHPVMPLQAARALSRLTVTEPLGTPVAALLRPCEIRAFVENVKQGQGCLDNLFLVSCTCPGVIPTKRFLEDDREGLQANMESSLRKACGSCIDFLPGPLADMVVVIASDTPADGTMFLPRSERAIRIAGDMEDFRREKAPPPEELVSGIRRKREQNRKSLMKGIPSESEGFAELVSLFSGCIGCRACRQACPLCSCVLCDYETARTIHPPELIRQESGRRGALRVPPGTLQFQLGRLYHIAPYCTGCGQCSDVCPVDIPLAEIFIRAGELVQASLGYSPGADPDQEPPLSVFLEHELQDITD